MTANPKCVRNDDPALDALELMVDNHFRHLPVLGKDGSIVGLLDIAKVLYDAISALEKVQASDGGSNDTSSSAVMTETMLAAMKAAAGGRGGNQAQLKMMQAMMEQMFGGSVPTLRSIIGSTKLRCMSPSQTVREASLVMSDLRKGVLVLEGAELVGILTPKDLLTRVVAKGLSPDEVLVSDVMTPNPDSVSADLTLLDALREMHDHKYLHLPVRDEDGRVVGMVGVMELLCSTAGGEGGSGWRDFFSGAMAARGDNDSGSETSSMHSGRGASIQQKSVAPSRRGSVHSQASKLKEAPKPKQNEKPVSKLRPKAPLTLSDDTTLLAVAEVMASKRVDAALLVSPEGVLSGIITDNDITRRVVAQFLDPMITYASAVMTADPKCVHNDDPALDALELMVDNHFRHLPVLGKDGSIVGLLDIAKVLYDAISALEKVQAMDEGSSPATASSSAMTDVMLKAMKAAAGGRGGNNAQLKMMQLMMEQMFGGSVPTLRSIIGSTKLPTVRASANVREAAILMAELRKGVLVMDDDELVGILTPKDVLTRVVAKGKSADLTAVSSVMTANPDCVSPDLTLLDALREMHDHKYLHLPVRDDDGSVVGLVDVMELLCNTAGGDGEGGTGWRDFFRGAMDARGDDDTASEASSIRSAGSRRTSQEKRKPKGYQDDDNSDIYPVDMRSAMSFDARGFETGSMYQQKSSHFIFKVTDSEGHVHRIKSSSESMEALKIAVGDKLKVHPDRIVLKYLDDESDEVILSTDSSLKEAVEFARGASMTALKLTAYEVSVENGATPITPNGKQPLLTAPTSPMPSISSNRKVVAAGSKPSAAEAVVVAAAPDVTVREAMDAAAEVAKKSATSSTTALLFGGGITAAALALLGAFAYLRSHR
jgi:CBS domain-containing protein